MRYRKPREQKILSIGFRKVFWPQAAAKSLCLLRRPDALPHDIPPSLLGHKSLEPLKVAQ